MRDTETVLWGIHAGRTGDADTLFLKKQCVALRFVKVGGFSALKPDREAFNARVAEVCQGNLSGEETRRDAHPESFQQTPKLAGHLFRFQAAIW